MLNQEEMNTLAASLDFWEKLAPGQKGLLTEGTRQIHFDRGRDLHCKKCECLGVLVIRSGSLRIYITSDEGREVTLYRLDQGDVCILSASCVLGAITFDVSLQAETDCSLLQIPSPVFARLATENVYAELFSYRLATERFSEVMWVMQQILFTSFDRRLAAFLLDESVRTGESTVHMTHEQVARHLGSAREVVSRMLKYFSDENCVSLSRGGITITDKKRLRSML